MEPEEIPGELPETTLIDQVEGVPGADSEESPVTSAVHAMSLDAEDRERLTAGESSASVVLDPAPHAPPHEAARDSAGRTASFPLADPRSADHGATLRRRVRRRRRLTSVLRAVVVCLAAYLVVFNLSVVRGSSMAPGIHDGDRILVGQWTYLLGDVERGDVVVMSYPVDPRLDYIKRVIGLPGDEIRMRGGDVFVNGEHLDEPYVDAMEDDLHYLTRVRPGHYFVLGDNRPHSSDSREFGQVPRELLKGRVDLRVWPLSRAGFVD